MEGVVVPTGTKTPPFIIFSLYLRVLYGLCYHRGTKNTKNSSEFVLDIIFRHQFYTTPEYFHLAGACFFAAGACFSLHLGCFSLHLGCFSLHLCCFNLHLCCFGLHLHSYWLHLHSYWLHLCSYRLHFYSYCLHFYSYRLHFCSYRLQMTFRRLSYGIGLKHQVRVLLRFEKIIIRKFRSIMNKLKYFESYPSKCFFWGV